MAFELGSWKKIKIHNKNIISYIERMQTGGYSKRMKNSIVSKNRDLLWGSNKIARRKEIEFWCLTLESRGYSDIIANIQVFETEHNCPKFWNLKISVFGYKNLTVSIDLLVKYSKVFPVRSGTVKVYSLSPLLFSILMEVLANAIRQDKEIKGIEIGKKTNKTVFVLKW